MCIPLKVCGIASVPTEPTPALQLNYSAAFLKQLRRLARKYRRIEADLQPVFDQLIAGQTPGDQVQGTGYTVYKLRVTNRDAQSGKSGGYRVIYYVQAATSRLLLAIYSKTEQEDIAAADLQRIIEDELAP